MIGKTKLIIALAGLTLIIGAQFFLLRPAPKMPSEVKQSTLMADYQESRQYMDWDAGQFWIGQITGTLEIGTEITYPKSISATEGFSISARAKLLKANCMSPLPAISPWTGRLVGTPAEKLKEEAEYNEDVTKFFAGGPVTYRLALTGATVSPTEPQRPKHEDARWSIMSADKAKKLVGHIEIEVDSTASRADSIKLRDRTVPFTIEVSEPVFTSTNFLRWGSTFLGSLLTLPGILSFLDNHRKRKSSPPAAA